ncbi:hypothetical protein [Streptomyces sp. NBC_01262]|uniref:hypothetical protein n=1 Tax=Streptomyces sp. NBC_01262 TaxID=2903803 RepID=UPI002E375E1A|nr:hypothetical protein [Streptomyces sp. NBC_01262]
MPQGLDDSREPVWIRTCFVRLPDGDVIAAFDIDGRQYTEPGQAWQVYREAWKEMSRRRAGWEWESHLATPSEPPSRRPSWEQYRVDLDAKHPLPSAD